MPSRGEVEHEVEVLAEPIIESCGFELVDVEYLKEQGDWVLRLSIDKPNGVTVEDCELASRDVGGALDERDLIPGAYRLEVLSPGAERPLKRAADYERFAGHHIAVSAYAPIEGRKRWKGRLQGLVEGEVVFETPEGVLTRIPLDKVAKAHLLME